MSNILTNNINPRSGNVINIGGINDKVSIAGTLSYEDVTNIDSVGVITARQGVHYGDVGSGVTITAVGAGTSLGFLVNNSERLRIDSSGKVGINQSSPDRRLHIKGAGSDADNNLLRFEINTAVTADMVLGGLEFEHQDVTSPGVKGYYKCFSEDGGTDIYHAWGVSGGATVSEALRIDSRGNVGINSTAPQNVFDVEGNEHTKLLVGTTGTAYATGLQITHAKGNAAEQKWQLQTDGSSDGNLKIRNSTSNTDHVFFDADNDETTFAGGVVVSGITTATQLYEGTTRVATSGKAIAMALIFG